MKVYVGVSYSRDHETHICGVADCREDARRIVEQSRNEILYWSKYATDGPDGGAALDDHRGDCVGNVLAFDVAGAANLKWRIDAENGWLTAESIYHDEGSPLCYTVFGEGSMWTADFDGKDFVHGTLEHCMAECRKSEDDAILESVQNDQELAESWSKPHGYVGDDEHVSLLKRMLNPEDLGMAIQPHVRDEVRKVLGMKPCESVG